MTKQVHQEILGDKILPLSSFFSSATFSTRYSLNEDQEKKGFLSSVLFGANDMQIHFKPSDELITLWSDNKNFNDYGYICGLSIVKFCDTDNILVSCKLSKVAASTTYPVGYISQEDYELLLSKTQSAKEGDIIEFSDSEKVVGKVIIHEMIIEDSEAEDTLYELHFEGSAEDYGFDDQTDYLTAEDAHEIAIQVSEETGSQIVWEGFKPGWAS